MLKRRMHLALSKHCGAAKFELKTAKPLVKDAVEVDVVEYMRGSTPPFCRCMKRSKIKVQTITLMDHGSCGHC